MAIALDNLSKQKIAKNIGDNGCYFLSVVYLAEELVKNRFDIIQLFAIANKKITGGLQWIEDDCFMNYPNLLLNYLTGKEVKVRKETDISYYPKNNEYIIGCFKWKTTGTTYSHFVVLDKNKNVIYDPLGQSNTVINGKLDSLRVFTVE